MTYFETKYFQKFSFTKPQIDRFLESALRDLKIARQDRFAELRFTYSYQALVKASIALIAKVGGVKVRSVPCHHVKYSQTFRHAPTADSYSQASISRAAYRAGAGA